MTKLFQRIDTIFVPTRDMSQAVKWYVDVLGGEPGWQGDYGVYDYLKKHGVKVEEVKEYGAKYFAFFDIDGNRLEVCEY